MLDLSALNIRYFNVRITDNNGKVIEVDLSEPKMKTIRKLGRIKNESDIDALFEAICMILNSNSQKYVFTEEFVEENMTADEVMKLLNAYFSWIQETKNNPN